MQNGAGFIFCILVMYMHSPLCWCTDISVPCTDMFVPVQECKTCTYYVCTCLYHVCTYKYVIIHPSHDSDENPIIVYTLIYSVYTEIYENLTSHTRTSRYILVWAKAMTPKLGTIYDFFMMSEYVLRQLPWQYMVWWSQKWKNSVKTKNSGNSVYLRIYCHVLSIPVHILSICKSKAT